MDVWDSFEGVVVRGSVTWLKNYGLIGNIVVAVDLVIIDGCD